MKKYNKYSIISLILSLVYVQDFISSRTPLVTRTWGAYYLAIWVAGIISLISGIIALRQIRHTNEKGKALAIIGIVVSGLLLLIELSIIVLFLEFQREIFQSPF